MSNTKKHTKIISIAIIIIEICILSCFILFGGLYIHNTRKKQEGTKTKEGFSDDEKVVICVELDDAKKRVKVVSETIVNDCRDNFISYNKDTQTFLYMNQKNQITERNRNGGITDNAAVLKFNDLLKEEAGSIWNIKYIPEKENISYIYDNDLYYFDYAAGQSNKIINGCAHSSGCDVYWIQPEKIYFIGYEEEKIQYSLYVQNEQQEITLVEEGIRSFCANDYGTKLYGVQGYIIPHAFGFSQEYRIVEIDLLQNTTRILGKMEGSNLILGEIDNQFLLYAEEDYEKKTTKVFQLNLQSGKTKCIYRTKKRVIGMI